MKGPSSDGLFVIRLLKMQEIRGETRPRGNAQRRVAVDLLHIQWGTAGVSGRMRVRR